MVQQSATLSYESAPDGAAPKRSLFARLFAARGVWALADQGVCSLGNFLTNVMLVRAWSHDQHLYGIYALVFYYVLVFLNTLHGSVVTYPLTLAGAAAGPARLRRLVFRGLTFTIMIAPLLGVAIAAACWRLDRVTLLPWALLAMMMWQLQETLRRSMIARLCHRCALPGDAMGFLGQALFVFLIIRVGGPLTPETVLAGVAITSGFAALVQLTQVMFQTRKAKQEPEPLPTPTLRQDAVDWWRQGRWLAVTCLVNVGTIYLTPWVLEATRGETEVASLNALNTLLNLTNPVVFGTASLIVPAVAAARASAATPREGFAAARAATVRYMFFGLALLLPYYLVVLIVPSFILRLFYGQNTPYVELADEVPLIVAIYSMLFFGYVIVSMLNGLGEARASFFATLASSLTTVALVVPMAAAFGLRGALAVSPIAILVQLVVAAIAAWRVSRRCADESPAIGPRPPRRVGSVSRAPRRLRVLINAYTLSPARGSEPGVGWGYCRNLAKHHDVTVLCAPGTPGAEHDIFKREIETWVKRNGPIPGLTLHYVPRPLLSEWFQREDEWSRRTLYYVGYNAWQKSALAEAKRLHADRPFDVVHQLNMTGFREPGYLWKLPDVPFVWGPIAGAANVPPPFFKMMTWTDRLYYRFRNWSSEIQKHAVWRCRQAAARASHIWTIGQASQRLVERIWGFPSETLVESGTTSRSDARVRRRDPSKPLKIVWSSLHIGRKALPVLLHAVARLEPRIRIEVTVLGSGPLFKPWQALAKKLGVMDRVTFLGRMPLADALKHVAGADVMAFTSIQDGTPQALLEAMSLGLPVIAHDACGMGAVLTDECGVKVPLVDPETSFEGFAAAIRQMHDEPELVGRLSAGALKRTAELDWSLMAARVAEVYGEIVAERENLRVEVAKEPPVRAIPA